MKKKWKSKRKEKEHPMKVTLPHPSPGSQIQYMSMHEQFFSEKLFTFSFGAFLSLYD